MSEAGRRARLMGIARALWPWAVPVALVGLGWNELRQIDLSAVRRLLAGTDPGLVLLLAALTAANLALAGCYDVAALGSARARPPLTARWAAGVVSFAWSNFLTIGPLAGPALRLWLYRRMDVEAGRGRRALGSVLLAFGAGLAAWGAAVLVPLPEAWDVPGVRILLALLAGAAIAGAWSMRAVRPSGPPLLVAVSLADWLLAWAVFHGAVTGFHGSVTTALSLRTFFLGQIVGMASLVPGGLGSADLFWAAKLGSEIGGHDRVVAALVLYRAVYYLLPFLAASLALGGTLVRTGRRTEAFLRTALASYAFLCGAVLLASAASPALHDRARFLARTVPVALVEVSHGVSVLMGFLLLVVSRGLARGYRSSHRVALGLFAAGAATTFAKGLDYEEALLALAAAGLLLLFHGAFRRTGRLHPSLEFVVSTGVFAVVLFVAVGMGSSGSFPAPTDVLARFGPGAHGERVARGLLLLTAAVTMVALRLGQRARAPEPLPDGPAIERALAAARDWGRSSNAMLVATGDKALFRLDPGDPDFIPYRAAGRFLVAWSDPVCRPGRERALLAGFLAMADDHDRHVALYQVGPAFLPVAHDFGFTFFKLGEEALVDLRAFDLKGNRAKSWRHALNAAQKAGARFEIVSGPALAARLPELRAVSARWLARKGGTEKGFSLGHFDEGYLMRFPCALVLDQAGAVKAFANVLEGPRREELSVDLMRWAPEEEGPLRLGMDYLILELLLHGKEAGFARFNLGMAPLASVGDVPWARPAERLAHQFFRHGEAWYNYQGLRRFKDKFDPQWEPRYLAYPRPWDWPFAVTAATVLISGGWRGLVPARAPA